MCEIITSHKCDLPLVIWSLTVQGFSFDFESESSLLSEASPGITHYNLIRLPTTYWTKCLSVYRVLHYQAGYYNTLLCIMWNRKTRERSEQLCFPDNTVVLPEHLTSCRYALFTSCDCLKSIRIHWLPTQIVPIYQIASDSVYCDNDHSNNIYLSCSQVYTAALALAAWQWISTPS